MDKLILRLFMVITSHVLCNCQAESTVSNPVPSIALEFMKKIHAHEAVIFNCEHRTDFISIDKCFYNGAAHSIAMSQMMNHQSFSLLCNVPLMKNLMLHGVQLSLQSPIYEENLIYLLGTKHNPLAIIVDLKCKNIFEILIKASDDKLFSGLNYWLVLNLHNESKEAIRAIIEPLYLTLNSHVTIAHHEAGLQNILLQDVYRVKDEEPLILASYPTWALGQKMPLSPRRDNYGGLTINIVIVVSQGTWESFSDPHYRHLNTESKVLYTFMTYISGMLNFRMNVSLTNTWGYPLNGSKCFNGAVGQLQCGDSEIIGSGLLYKKERMNVIDYAGDTIKLRSAFFFLKPSLSAVSITYILPFSPTVWIVFAFSMIVLTISLVFSMHLLRKIVPHSLEKLLYWKDSILDTVAIVCQQGTLWNPACISSRIVFLLQLMLSVFLITSYSAIIVSLLQTSSDKIKSMNDLMNSSMKLSMIDIYINETTDPQVTRIFEQKLYTQPFHEAFTTQEVGIEKIRRGLYAFHGIAGAYKIISETYEAQEKCRLKEIPMFASLDMSFGLKKGSPFAEHIKQKTQWLRESGLMDHEDKRWFYQRPKCDRTGQFFVSISIQDFYPALVILAFGILLSIVMFLIEYLQAYITKKQDALVLYFTL